MDTHVPSEAVLVSSATFPKRAVAFRGIELQMIAKWTVTGTAEAVSTCHSATPLLSRQSLWLHAKNLGRKRGEKKIRQRVSRNNYTGGHLLPGPVIITYLRNTVQYSMRMLCLNSNDETWWWQSKWKTQSSTVSPNYRLWTVLLPATLYNKNPHRH